jgi:hypothetical protein
MSPRYVNIDASWRDGYAGIAVVGALGTHARCIRTRSSTEAEKEAMRLAFALARCSDDGRGVLVFRTDCATAAGAFTASIAKGWRTELVPRRQNTVAHGVASRARRTDESRRAGLRPRMDATDIERFARWAESRA